jgi:hypothetical protein
MSSDPVALAKLMRENGYIVVAPGEGSVLAELLRASIDAVDADDAYWNALRIVGKDGEHRTAEESARLDAYADLSNTSISRVRDAVSKVGESALIRRWAGKSERVGT